MFPKVSYFRTIGWLRGPRNGIKPPHFAGEVNVDNPQSFLYVCFYDKKPSLVWF